MTADSIIKTLGLEPHPEGGAYRETYRSRLMTSDGTRSLATMIYFLLRAGERSRWHRVRSDELWLFHAGDPLRLRQVGYSGLMDDILLGSELGSKQRPQYIIRGGNWQSGEPVPGGPSGWTLVSCVVSPGFDFTDFEIATDEQMQSLYPRTTF